MALLQSILDSNGHDYDFYENSSYIELENIKRSSEINRSYADFNSENSECDVLEIHVDKPRKHTKGTNHGTNAIKTHDEMLEEKLMELKSLIGFPNRRSKQAINRITRGANIIMADFNNTKTLASLKDTSVKKTFISEHLNRLKKDETGDDLPHFQSTRNGDLSNHKQRHPYRNNKISKTKLKRNASQPCIPQVQPLVEKTKNTETSSAAENYNLKMTNNSDIKDWLKHKNQEIRKQKLIEKQKSKEDRKAIRKVEKVKEQRKLLSDIKFQEWLNEKSKDGRLLKRDQIQQNKIHGRDSEKSLSFENENRKNDSNCKNETRYKPSKDFNYCKNNGDVDIHKESKENVKPDKKKQVENLSDDKNHTSKNFRDCSSSVCDRQIVNFSVCDPETKEESEDESVCSSISDDVSLESHLMDNSHKKLNLNFLEEAGNETDHDPEKDVNLSNVHENDSAEKDLAITDYNSLVKHTNDKTENSPSYLPTEDRGSVSLKRGDFEDNQSHLVTGDDFTVLHEADESERDDKDEHFSVSHEGDQTEDHNDCSESHLMDNSRNKLNLNFLEEACDKEDVNLSNSHKNIKTENYHSDFQTEDRTSGTLENGDFENNQSHLLRNVDFSVLHEADESESDDENLDKDEHFSVSHEKDQTEGHNDSLDPNNIFDTHKKETIKRMYACPQI